jgi:hypothetical protein
MALRCVLACLVASSMDAAAHAQTPTAVTLDLTGVVAPTSPSVSIDTLPGVTVPDDPSCTGDGNLPVGCTATATDSRIHLSRECVAGVGQVSNWQLNLTCTGIAFNVGLPSGDPIEMSIVDGRLHVGAGVMPAGAMLAIPRPNGWQTYTATSPGTDIANLSPPVHGFYRAEHGAWQRAAVARRVSSARREEDVCGDTIDAERFCDQQLEHVSQGACFIEAEGTDDLQLVRLLPSNHAIRANNSFVVVACIESQHSLRGTLSGVAGLTDPSIDQQARQGDTNALELGGQQPPPVPQPTHRLARLSFAPRQPGPAIDLKLTLRDANGIVDTLETELVVEQTYSGALRLGIGIPLIAVDRSYSATLVGGSDQHEIVATGSGADVELVVTLAAFVEALHGGRSYTGADGSDFLEHWGLFVAAGIVSSTQNGVEFLTSIYVGLEWEPIRSISFGFGYVLRRVHRLIDGYEVGDAAMAGATLSEPEWTSGVGFVIGVSPEFLQFAGALVEGS